MRWFPNNKGMAMGIVVGGFGGGAFIFNQIQTAILNPDNIATDGEYFTDEELLNRVPNLMLILGGDTTIVNELYLYEKAFVFRNVRLNSSICLSPGNRA